MFIVLNMLFFFKDFLYYDQRNFKTNNISDDYKALAAKQNVKWHVATINDFDTPMNYKFLKFSVLCSFHQSLSGKEWVQLIDDRTVTFRLEKKNIYI